MKGKFSQNNEDILIEKYFGERIGTLLSLGENDGKSLSNALAAIERGWSAVLVEPSETAFEKLVELHAGRENVYCYNVAIGEADGEQDFFESGEHLGNGDTALISTLKQSETQRWKGTKFDNFKTTKTDVFTWETFYKDCPLKQFNLISIDCEGFDLFIISQMNLSQMGCEMLIVEWNGKQFTEFNTIAVKHGLHLHDKNGENLIFVK
jgi:FkbM family methyltransferase